MQLLAGHGVKSVNGHGLIIGALVTGVFMSVLFDRAVLGAAILGVPITLVSAFLVSWDELYLMWAAPLAGALLGAALAVAGVQPFPWLESKLPYDATD